MPPSPIPLPIPIDVEPSSVDIWMTVITGLAALFSLVVAISAVVAAWQARAIANDSEEARVQFENRREALEYDDRLNESLARLFTTIGDQFAPMREWMTEADDLEMHSVTDANGDIAYPAEPTLEAVAVEAQIVRMIARDNDAAIARELAYAIALVENQPVSRRRIDLRGIVDLIGSWRAGEKTNDDVLRWFKEYEKTHDPRK